MEQMMQDSTEAAASAPAHVSNILEMNVSGAVKSLEVRANGIYDTSNQSAESSLDTVSSSLKSPTNPKEDAAEQPADSAASSAREPQSTQSEPKSEAAAVIDERERATNADVGDLAVAHHDVTSPPAVTDKLLPVDTAAQECCASSPDGATGALAIRDSSVSEHECSSSHERAGMTTHSNGVVSDDILHDVQTFLAAKIQENQIGSHAQEILEYVAQRLSASQQQRELPMLVQRIVEQFAHEAQMRGDIDVSVDVQSGVCQLELMLLGRGRVSPLQDMYTAEEEALLESLAVSSARSDSSA